MEFKAGYVVIFHTAEITVHMQCNYAHFIIIRTSNNGKTLD